MTEGSCNLRKIYNATAANSGVSVHYGILVFDIIVHSCGEFHCNLIITLQCNPNKNVSSRVVNS